MSEIRRRGSEYDAIIIGGGLSGLNAAYFLAKAGYNTILFERLPKKGLLDHPCGAMISPIKDYITFENTSDGILFKETDFLFRNDMIIDYPRIMKFTVPNGKSFGMELENPKEHLIFQIDKQKVITSLAERAERAGAHLIYGKTISRLLIENKLIKGVIAGDNEFRASLVLSGEGLSRRFTRQANLFASAPKGYIFAYAIYLKNLSLDYKKRGQFGYFGEQLSSVPKSSVLFHSYGKKKGLIFITLFLDDFKWSYEKSVEVYLENAISNIPFLKQIFEQGRLYDKNACWIKLMIPSNLVANGFIGMGDSIAPLGHSSNSIAMLMGKRAAETSIGALNDNNFSATNLQDYNELLKSNLFEGVKFEGNLISEMLNFSDQELNTLGKIFSDIDLTPFFIGSKWQMIKSTMNLLFKKGIIKNWKLLKQLF